MDVQLRSGGSSGAAAARYALRLPVTALVLAKLKSPIVRLMGNLLMSASRSIISASSSVSFCDVWEERSVCDWWPIT